jgi:hypothetical protein
MIFLLVIQLLLPEKLMVLYGLGDIIALAN